MKLLLAALLSTAPISFLACAPTTTHQDRPLTAAEVAKRATPSVVSVRTAHGSGSGFVVRKDGWIATNRHVLMSGPATVDVSFRGQSVVYRVVEVVVADDRDLALLHIDAKDLPVLRLADTSATKPGDKVVAIGNPLGLQLSVSDGIVSARRSLVELGVRSADEVIQHTAPISHGNSGGPLLNEKGEVVGVNTLVGERGENLGFALPSEYVKDLMRAPRPISLAAFALSNDRDIVTPHICSGENVEDCAHECKRGELTSCVLDGALSLRAGDTTTAEAAFDRACKGGNQMGCAWLGVMSMNGKGVPQDFGRAAKIFRDTCDAGEAAGCSLLAGLYTSGRGVKQDPARAVSLFEKACDMGHVADCRTLGERYQSGKGATRDLARATRYYERACDGRDATSCRLVAQAYATGTGAARDDERATTFYQRACDGGDLEACGQLGSRLLEGKGVARDPDRAVAYLRRACKRGPGWACEKLRENGTEP